MMHTNLSTHRVGHAGWWRSAWCHRTSTWLLRGATLLACCVGSACNAADDGCACDDGYVPLLVDYAVHPNTEGSADVPFAELAVNEEDRRYTLLSNRDRGISQDEPGCGTSGHGPCTGYTLETLCLRGELDDASFTTVLGLFDADSLEVYAEDGARDGAKVVTSTLDHGSYESPEAGHETYFFGDRASLQPETVKLLDTLEDLMAELFARAEYCSEEDEASAGDGEWWVPGGD